jgi:hypothetical protein
MGRALKACTVCVKGIKCSFSDLLLLVSGPSLAVDVIATDVVDMIEEEIGFCIVDDGDDVNGLMFVVI